MYTSSYSVNNVQNLTFNGHKGWEISFYTQFDETKTQIQVTQESFANSLLLHVWDTPVVWVLICYGQQS